MDCRETRERLSDYRDGSLSETVADGISRHLRECAGCAEVARSLDAVREGLRNLPPVPAPPELLGRIREAIASKRRLQTAPRPGPLFPAESAS